MTSRDDILAIAVPQIKSDEDLRLEAYPDPLSGGEPWTIGYGQTGPGITQGTVWTLEQAEEGLSDGLEAICDRLDAELPWWTTMNAPRASVLPNMAWNMGVGGLLGFHNMLAAAEAGQFSEAADQMLASRWATQVRNRAGRLAAQMESGIMQNGETS